MIHCVVFGATGYAGSELVRLLQRHASFKLIAAFGSPLHEARSLQHCVPQIHFDTDIVVEPALPERVANYQFDLAFLALSHEHSAYWAAHLVEQGKTVIDLSGAFRFQDEVPYTFMAAQKKPAKGFLSANPGCYPTAALLSLKPLVEAGLVQPDFPIAITGMSGVSGAGRGANERTSFCEVSVQPYGVLTHRHQPEISRHLSHDVVFTPVLVAIPRGLVVVCQAQLNSPLTQQEFHALYQDYYVEKKLVKIVEQAPAAHHAAYSPFGLIFPSVKGQVAVITCAIDNLLMGAASQALQAANHAYSFNEYEGILPW